MKKFSSNWKKVASNVPNIRKQAKEHTDSVPRGIRVEKEGIE